MRKALGNHIILEFHGCPKNIIKNYTKVKEIFLEATRVSNAHPINSLFHEFNPYGISGVIIIAESHFTVHTWPEYGYCAVDLFSCSADIDFDKAVEYLRTHLKPKSVSRLEFKRGIF